jgi:hypothetical protein
MFVRSLTPVLSLSKPVLSLSKGDDLLWLPRNLLCKLVSTARSSLRERLVTAFKQVVIKSPKQKTPPFGRGLSLCKESDDDLLSHA